MDAYEIRRSAWLGAAAVLIIAACLWHWPSRAEQAASCDQPPPLTFAFRAEV